MCGIFGIVNRTNLGVDLSVARRAVELLRHRGPDDEGYLLIDSRAARAVACQGPDTAEGLSLPDLADQDGAHYDLVFGHRRLSIIDVSIRGHQPMASRDGRLWLVFNGEVYNYIELRRELEKEGVGFDTATDTEVVLAAYQRWGASCLSRFVGMFACAIYDMNKRELFLARDFFGIKPLYYASMNGRFVFASEIPPLLELPGITREVNPQALYEYLRFGITDGAAETLFADIRELPPAHYATLPLDSPFGPSPRCYWRIDLSRRARISPPEAAAQLRDLLAQSVRLHMRSDVPLGTCLSGGLDSTAILMNMSTKLDRGQQLHGFSFITDDPVLSEDRYVDVARQAARAVCHKVNPLPDELAQDLPRLIRVQQLPFSSTSIYAQYRVFQLARQQGMKVMLDGQGSDELFAGYLSFLGSRLAGLMASGRLLAAARVLRQFPQNMRQHFVRLLLTAAGRLLPEGLVPFFRRVAQEPLWPPWLNQRWFQDRGVVAREHARGKGRDALREDLLLSVMRVSLPQLLRYEDRNSMCHSIESRVPFCVPSLAEFAFSLPDDLLVSPTGDTKVVLKAAMRGLVPDTIIQREKVGFGTPERQWLAAIRPYVETTVSRIQAAGLPFLCDETRVVRRALASDGRWPTHAWRIFNTCVWAQSFDVNCSV
jgi:asparagine synthase (glutamine-hydrolysing)